ncbi:MAG: nucleotidyltransferase family protein [Paracoccaceae bacterium]
MQTDIPILILAAGQSSRMRGRDKLAEVVDGLPQLTRITTAACATSQQVHVALVPSRLSMIAALPAKPLILLESAEGMGGTLRAGVAALPDCKRFMVLLADMPDIGVTEIRLILQAADTWPDALIWRGITPDGQPGHPILFHAELRTQFQGLKGDAGGENIVGPLRDETCFVPLAQAREDLDTPEDWANWRHRRDKA